LKYVHLKKLCIIKTKDKNVKDFDTVKIFREIKDKISKDIQGMNFEQLTVYINNTKLKPHN
jgi:hypothetical protein